MCEKWKISKNTAIAIAFGGVILIWAVFWLGINQYFQSYSERGAFGDMFGAVNALFSGLAFAGLIITLLYQKDELKLQREELEETRAEMARQRKEFEEQNKTLKCQRFENTFFSMLSLQQEITSNLIYEYVDSKLIFSDSAKKTSQCKGRELFRFIYEKVNIPINENRYLGLRRVLNDYGYEKYSEISVISLFDHYFRHLYRIYKYIDRTNLIEDEERYEYACIIRSQLSNYELIMLFYNCLSENGREQFKPLIEKYSVFNNLREDLLVKPDDKLLYENKAYNR